MVYAEIGITTNFSFLRGASHPQDYVHQASAYGLPAIGIADRNTLAGVVRAYGELTSDKLPGPAPRLLVGARLVFTDGTPDILAYPRDRPAYGRLCQLLSLGKLRADKGECDLALVDLLEFREGQLLVLIPPHRCVSGKIAGLLTQLNNGSPEGVWLAASWLYRGDDARRLARLQRVAATAGVPLLATNDVLYHHPARRTLQDVVTCIREKTTIDGIGRRLEANAERHLKPAREMTRLFQAAPEAIAETLRFAARIEFALDDLKYQYPDEPVPKGKTAQRHLQDLTWTGAHKFFPIRISPKTKKTLWKELRLIRKLKYAHYFLTVHDIVHWAKDQNILCQGRGSAANSAVCFVLGITAVNPTEVEVLFERFISKERLEPPDIDVDFEHSRREEVMQYVYRRYGRHRAAVIATVAHYRPRSAIRDVGKALGLTEDVTAALADTVWGGWGRGFNPMQVEQAGLSPENPTVARAVGLATQLIGFPRHLSQHVGGYVLTQDRLDTYVPIGNAAMDGRTFIEWDKDDVDTLKMMKVDILALGMLTCIRKCFDLIAQHKGERYRLADIQSEDDNAVYRMLQRGESLGVFQVESRAQMNMLPRLKPRTFYDLVIEVAIVRPGPIQGNMVHPYLKRRKMDPNDIDYPYPKGGDPNELKDVLKKTLGVPLFQEQAMRIAMKAAEFTSEEANGLRRAMATFRNVGTMPQFEERMVNRMIARGYDPEFARSCFDQIKGFGSYGFPESHAASFAQLVYVSSWLKHYHPDAFCCGLLNSQPMGFYAPAQIVRDARDNGVTVREIDVSFSFGQNTLEERCGKHHAVRLGFRQIDGFLCRDEDAESLRELLEQFSGAEIHEGTDCSLPPCGGGLGRGVNSDLEPSSIPLSTSPPPSGQSHMMRWSCSGRNSPHPTGLRPATLPLQGRDRLAASLCASYPSHSGEGGRAKRGRVGEKCKGVEQALLVSTSEALTVADDWDQCIVAARTRRPFTSLEDFARATQLPKRALVLLADADAFRSLGLDRRAALWAVRRLPDAAELPLFKAADVRDLADEAIAPLPRMADAEQVVADYQTVRLSLKGHPMQFLRPMFAAERAITCAAVSAVRDRQKARCAGVVLVRQRPGSAKGVVFMTLEDETGIANIVVWPAVMERFRKEVMGARLLLVEGVIQSSEDNVVHLVAARLIDRSADLMALSNDALGRPPVPLAGFHANEFNDDRREHPDSPAQKIRHPRNVRILPRSRDFH